MDEILELEKTYSVKETAKILDMCTRNVYRWISNGWLSAYAWPSGRLRITEASILKAKTGVARNGRI
jgi:predicted site-specific integrase-resolvase